MPQSRFISVVAPLIITLGALLLLVAAASEIVAAVQNWLGAGTPLPGELMLHVLVAGAALLLAAAVLVMRRSGRRTEAAEEALRESEARLRLVANSVPALISYVDREQRYRFSNRTYDDWFGIAHESMQGRTLAEVFGAEAHERMRASIERVLGGEEVQFEFTTAE